MYSGCTGTLIHWLLALELDWMTFCLSLLALALKLELQSLFEAGVGPFSYRLLHVLFG